MKLQALLPALITAAFLSTTLGSVIYSESVFANSVEAAFVECQSIKPKGKSFAKMREKKNCFKQLVVSPRAGQFDPADECRNIKIKGKSFGKMKEKKNCFRDLAKLHSERGTHTHRRWRPGRR